jgi:hypothetical protein
MRDCAAGFMPAAPAASRKVRAPTLMRGHQMGTRPAAHGRLESTPTPPAPRTRARPKSLIVFWRPRPESNRRTRICSPLRHHSATRPPGQLDIGLPDPKQACRCRCGGGRRMSGAAPAPAFAGRHPWASHALVRTAGVEPAWACARGILSPLRLPVPPRPHAWAIAPKHGSRNRKPPLRRCRPSAVTPAGSAPAPPRRTRRTAGADRRAATSARGGTARR